MTLDNFQLKKDSAFTPLQYAQLWLNRALASNKISERIKSAAEESLHIAEQVAQEIDKLAYDCAQDINLGGDIDFAQLQRLEQTTDLYAAYTSHLRNILNFGTVHEDKVYNVLTQANTFASKKDFENHVRVLTPKSKK